MCWICIFLPFVTFDDVRSSFRKRQGMFPIRRVVRNLQWGGYFGVWGRSPQIPEANGGLRAKPPAAKDWESGGKAPSRRRHGRLEVEPPALENFAFFEKIT